MDDDRRISPRCMFQAPCRLAGSAAQVLDISHEGIRLQVDGPVAGSLLHLSWYLNGYHLERPLRVRWAAQTPDGRLEIGALFAGNPKRDSVLQKFVHFANWCVVAARRPTPGVPPTGLVRQPTASIPRLYKSRLLAGAR